MTSLLSHALAWLDRGFPVFPLRPRDKIPLGSLVPHGCLDASTDPAVIRDWWRREPRANIGGGLGNGRFALDLDGQDAVLSFANTCDRHGGAPRTLTVRTARGWHLYFSSSVPIPCSTGRIAPHIDVRGSGGYIVAPPSEHPSGSVYALARDLPIAEAPQWLVDLALPPPPQAVQKVTARPLTKMGTARAIEGVIGVVANASAGQRNALLFWGAIKVAEMAAIGRVTLHEGEACLVEAGAQAGLPTMEARRTVASAFHRIIAHG